MTVDADNLESAKAKFKEMMTPEVVAAHVAEKHPAGEPVPTQEEVNMQIEQGVVEGDLTPPQPATV